jgi:hypothetical protein
MKTTNSLKFLLIFDGRTLRRVSFKLRSGYLTVGKQHILLSQGGAVLQIAKAVVRELRSTLIEMEAGRLSPKSGLAG